MRQDRHWASKTFDKMHIGKFKDRLARDYKRTVRTARLMMAREASIVQMS